MLALLTPIIGLVTEALKLMEAKEATKYIDQMTNLKIEIQKEEDKGYESDDAKIESMYKELKVVIEAVQAQMAMHNASK